MAVGIYPPPELELAPKTPTPFASFSYWGPLSGVGGAPSDENPVLDTYPPCGPCDEPLGALSIDLRLFSLYLRYGT